MASRVARAQTDSPNILGSFVIDDAERARLGHLAAWSSVAREVVALYLDAIERNPVARVVVTISA